MKSILIISNEFPFICVYANIIAKKIDSLFWLRTYGQRLSCIYLYREMRLWLFITHNISILICWTILQTEKLNLRPIRFEMVIMFIDFFSFLRRFSRLFTCTCSVDRKGIVWFKIICLTYLIVLVIVLYVLQNCTNGERAIRCLEIRRLHEFDPPKWNSVHKN